MNRYQIYLDPDRVAVADRVAASLNVSRSHVIRDVFDRVMREYEKVLESVAKTRFKNHSILKMSGIGRSSTGRIAEDVDSIYLRD